MTVAPAPVPTAPPASGTAIAAAFVGARVIWGGTFLVIRLGNETVPPLWAASLRLAIAGALLIALTLGLRQSFPRGSALRAALYYGVFQFGLNFPLLYWGQTGVSSGLAAVLYATTPLSGALFAVAFGLERFRAATLAGAAIAIAGVALIFRGTLTGELSAVHTLSVFAAATLAAFGTTLFKRGGRQAVFPANAVACAAGLPFALAASFALGERHALPHGLAGWGPLLYLAIAGSIGAFVLFSWLVQRWDVSRAAFVGVVVPVIAVILGAIFRAERIGRDAAFGSLLVLTGLAAGMGLFAGRRRAG